MATNITLPLELLECIICRDTYKDPIDLNCGHNFCRQCIVDYASKIEQGSGTKRKCSCPICREAIELVSSELGSRPGNYTLKNIVDAVNKNLEVLSPKCILHSEVYIVYCNTCNEAKCFDCLSTSCKVGHETEDMETLTRKLQQDIKTHLIGASSVTSTSSNIHTRFPNIQEDLKRLAKIRSILIRWEKQVCV